MGLINENLFSKEELEQESPNYKQLIYWFNKINDDTEGKVDELNYLDYYKQAKEQIRIEDWLSFLSDYRIAAILDKVMLMNMRSSVNKLMNDTESKSTAGAQKLTSALNFLAKYFDDAMGKENTVFIYTSVPLTKEEEFSRNAKTLLVRPKINPNNPAVPGKPNQTTKR
jgi:DUF438 domain-containing protein